MNKMDYYIYLAKNFFYISFICMIGFIEEFIRFNKLLKPDNSVCCFFCFLLYSIKLNMTINYLIQNDFIKNK